ncbi:exodeoxyribonuclease VII large subunit [Pseudactinotalea sp. HY160]|uniref:exodeoxyribonuclease VII large subunit n=1 Tax=Pseudactinotalea sp. HY160 TaxID=2654490 RepID=UPI00128D210F|nr:exodeoxyribonuclease VII large subunit [Pseudactinotalea sp. HY160]MPV48734.1 exodeoxyribonuclease VII large subunit [Pseudactinotalea sp. HY160]
MSDPQPPTPRERPATAASTSAESPWPVRLLSLKMSEYISRMSPVWVEGQVVQLNARNASSLAFLTLRDTDVDMSLSVTIPKRTLLAMPAPPGEGDHVVVHAKPELWAKRGSLSLAARSIRAVGLGELLARIEQLRSVLAAEGLFAAERKRPLPFLPARVGLVCGRAAKAQDDVLVNARARWPEVLFEIREVAVQGGNCVPQVVAAIAELDADPRVDVIIVTRGGGSVEDLLPFSNETLVRAAAAAHTPIVSAIGHETDAPLLDLVADVRASTPTAAAKRVVPDVAGERAHIAAARTRMSALVRARIEREQSLLTSLRSRPVLTTPTVVVDRHADAVADLRRRLRGRLEHRLESASHQLDGTVATLRALSPQSTLARGYAVLHTHAGEVIRDPAQVATGASVHARLARGRLDLIVDGAAPARPSAAPEPTPPRRPVAVHTPRPTSETEEE